MLRETIEEVESANEEAYNYICEHDYNSFILLIGRADVVYGLKQHVGTDCVIDYQGDRYYDETRESFYIRYLNPNYKKESYDYPGTAGLDDLSIEMMIYIHL